MPAKDKTIYRGFEIEKVEERKPNYKIFNSQYSRTGGMALLGYTVPKLRKKVYSYMKDAKAAIDRHLGVEKKQKPIDAEKAAETKKYENNIDWVEDFSRQSDGSYLSKMSYEYGAVITPISKDPNGKKWQVTKSKHANGKYFILSNARKAIEASADKQRGT